MKVSIVIPTYNESENIENFILTLEKKLHRHNVHGEIIVVDDNSPDGTSEIVARLAKKYKNLKLLCRKNKRGKGSAIADGAKLAKYENIAMIDADFQYNPEDIFRLLAAAKNRDIVVTRRVYESLPFTRKVLSSTFRFLQKLVLRLGVGDTQSGLKLLKKTVFESIKLDETGFAFDIELLLKARKKGFSIKEVPIKFHERTRGKSKVGVLKTSFELLLKCVSLKLKIDLFGKIEE